MERAESRLYGLPCAESMEAPSSWISRAALSQGVGAPALLKYLQIRSDADIDMSIALADQAQLQKLCSLPRHHLEVSIRVLRNLVKSRCDPAEFLMYSKRRRLPRFRYCPHCLRDSVNPSLLIHWRFAAFRYCPLHACMLEERCHACKADVIGAVSLMHAGPDRRGLASLKYCAACGADLRAAPTLGRSEAFALLDQIDQVLIRNGRSVLAALFQGRVWLGEGPDERFGISKLRKINKMRIIPNAIEWHDTDLLKTEFAARMQERARQHEAELALRRRGE